MGCMSVVVIRNDALGDIAGHKLDFGHNLVQAIQHGSGDVAAGPHANAATVVSVRHAETPQLVIVQDNIVVLISDGGACEGCVAKSTVRCAKCFRCPSLIDGYIHT